MGRNNSDFGLLCQTFPNEWPVQWVRTILLRNKGYKDILLHGRIIKSVQRVPILDILLVVLFALHITVGCHEDTTARRKYLSSLLFHLMSRELISYHAETNLLQIIITGKEN